MKLETVTKVYHNAGVVLHCTPAGKDWKSVAMRTLGWRFKVKSSRDAEGSDVVLRASVMGIPVPDKWLTARLWIRAQLHLAEELERRHNGGYSIEELITPKVDGKFEEVRMVYFTPEGKEGVNTELLIAPKPDSLKHRMMLLLNRPYRLAKRQKYCHQLETWYWMPNEKPLSMQEFEDIVEPALDQYARMQQESQMLMAKHRLTRKQ